jgi:hypothetical protein
MPFQSHASKRGLSAIIPAMEGKQSVARIQATAELRASTSSKADSSRVNSSSIYNTMSRMPATATTRCLQQRGPYNRKENLGNRREGNNCSNTKNSDFSKQQRGQL